MTNREYHESIANGIMNDELMAHARAELEKMEKRAAERAAKPTKKQIENEPIKTKILEALETEPMTICALAEVVGVSSSKISGIGRGLVNEGLITVSDVKVPSKGTQKLYTLA